MVMKHVLRSVVMCICAAFLGWGHAHFAGRPIGASSNAVDATSSSSSRYTSRGHPYITPAYGGELLASRAADFVDAGTALDYDRGRIPGAVLISLDEFSNGGYPTRLEAMSRDRTIVVYCASGCSSAEYVAQRIREFGFEQTLILAEGFAAWKAAGLPVEGSVR